MFKIMDEKATNHLINLIPTYEPTIRTRNNSIPSYKCRTNCFKHSFFPTTLNDWFNLDINIRNSESFTLFKCRLLSFICPVQNSIYNIFDTKGLKFLTRLRLGLSRLNAQDCLNPLCSCSLETEDSSHYLLNCHHFSKHHAHLVNSVKSVCDNFDSMSGNVKKNVLLYSNSHFDEVKNRFIFEGTITYIRDSEFSGYLFD